MNFMVRARCGALLVASMLVLGCGLFLSAHADTVVITAGKMVDVLAGRGPGPSPTQPGSTTVPRRPSHDQLR